MGHRSRALMEPLTSAEAFVGIALCAAYADGSMGAEEDEALAEELQTCRALRHLAEPELRAAMMKADGILSKEGEAALLARAAASLTPQMRATAFCLGADLVFADDELAPEERAFIERLRRSLGVEPGMAQRILDVLQIRARA